MAWIDNRGFRISPRRIAAMVVAIGCHFALLMFLLRPAGHRPVDTPFTVDEAVALELRFVALPPTAVVTVAPSARIKVAATVRRTSTQPAPKTTETVEPAKPTTALPSPVSHLPNDAAAIPPTMGDGGFQAQLRQAQHAHDVHGVPGSDRRSAPGIQLTDPMNQGVGAVMRNAQRLFGITNRHCIDVEVWQSLTPEERSERHLSPEDIRRQAETYHCNRPLGLSF